MNLAGLSRGSLSVLAAFGILAGCGGAQSAMNRVVPSDSVTAQSQVHRASSSGTPLVYTFGSFHNAKGLILSYPAGTVVNNLTAPFSPDGICSDADGNVFIGGQDASTVRPVMAEYAYGATSASSPISIGNTNGSVRGCSIDQTTGNVAALIQYDSFNFAVAVLPHFTGTPQIYQDTSIYRFLSVGYDGSGNLYLLGASPGSSAYYLAELPSGGSSLQPISLNLGSNATELRTLQWDGSRITLEGGYNPGFGKPKTWTQAVYQLTISGSSASVAATIKLRAHNKDFQTSWIAPSVNALVLTQGKIRFFKYPAGGKETKRIKTGQGPANMGTVALPTSR